MRVLYTSYAFLCNPWGLSVTNSIDWPAFDHQHIGHPYSAIDAQPAPYPVVSAQG